MSVSYGGDGITFPDNSVQTSSSTGFKNRVINGDMRINQRQNTAMTLANTASYYYATDRNMFYQDTTGLVGTVLQSTEAPNGFANSIAISVTTGQTPIAGAQNILAHFIEYNNVKDLAWGTADAKPVTLSFWVKSSLTGTFGGGVYNYAYNKNYIYSYTINQANTWEYKTISVSGPTDGDWTGQGLIGRGIILRWDTGSGTDFQTGTYNQWGTALRNAPTSATRIIANSGATFYITGIQFEKGTSASSFEYRPIQTELALCQRYYWRWKPVTTRTYIGPGAQLSSAWMYGYVKVPVTMRINPSLETSGTASDYGAYVGANFVSCDIVPAMDTTHQDTPLLGFRFGTGQTVGTAGIIGSGTVNGFLGFTAEL